MSEEDLSGSNIRSDIGHLRSGRKRTEQRYSMSYVTECNVQILSNIFYFISSQCLVTLEKPLMPQNPTWKEKRRVKQWQICLIVKLYATCLGVLKLIHLNSEVRFYQIFTSAIKIKTMLVHCCWLTFRFNFLCSW